MFTIVIVLRTRRTRARSYLRSAMPTDRVAGVVVVVVAVVNTLNFCPLIDLVHPWLWCLIHSLLHVLILVITIWRRNIRLTPVVDVSCDSRRVVVRLHEEESVVSAWSVRLIVRHWKYGNEISSVTLSRFFHCAGARLFQSTRRHRPTQSDWSVENFNIAVLFAQVQPDFLQTTLLR